LEDLASRNNHILVLGVAGMLGNTVFRWLNENTEFHIYGSVRSTASLRFFNESLHRKIFKNVDISDQDQLINLIKEIKPNLIINCIGLIKQVDISQSPLVAIPINSILPHRLANIASLIGARLIHISTDCVFSGLQGMYKESDVPDAIDLYGRTKLLGEVDYPNAITLRTSIIGHELMSARSLIGWFLSQEGIVKGYRRAVFSGLPTIEIARIICDHVIPNPGLHGLYHVSSDPINKYDLLQLVKKEYNKIIDIEPDDVFEIDRSLDSTRFRTTTGYKPPPWVDLIKEMHKFG